MSFDVQNVLGRGSYGTVYLGVITRPSTQTEVPCAIKVISDGISIENRKGLLADISAAFYARNPFVVKLYGLHFTHGAAHITMGEAGVVLSS